MMNYFYLLLLMGFLGCCVKSPRWGVAAMAFVLPLSRRLPSLEIPFLNTENLVVLAPLVALLVGSMREKGAGKVRFVLPLLVFLLLVTVSLLNALIWFEPPARLAHIWNPYNVFLSYKNLLVCLLAYVV